MPATTRSSLSAIRRSVIRLPTLAGYISDFLPHNDLCVFTAALTGNLAFSRMKLLFNILRYGNKKQLVWWFVNQDLFDESLSHWKAAIHQSPSGAIRITDVVGRHLFTENTFSRLQLIICNFELDCVSRWRAMAAVLMCHEKVSLSRKINLFEILVSTPMTGGLGALRRHILSRCYSAERKPELPPFKTLGWALYSLAYCLDRYSDLKPHSPEYVAIATFIKRKMVLYKKTDNCKTQDCIYYRCDCCCQRGLAYRKIRRILSPTIPRVLNFDNV